MGYYARFLFGRTLNSLFRQPSSNHSSQMAYESIRKCLQRLVHFSCFEWLGRSRRLVVLRPRFSTGIDIRVNEICDT